MKNKHLLLTLLFLLFAYSPYVYFKDAFSIYRGIEGNIWTQLTILYISIFIGAYQEIFNSKNGIAWMALFICFATLFTPLGQEGKYQLIFFFYIFYPIICAMVSGLLAHLFTTEDQN